jgi:purine-nucleoside/S-methyl-5'-thioadenosine phosphorylase / adenosine deaminase
VSGRPGGTRDALLAPGRPHALCDGVRVLFTERAGGVSTGSFREFNLSDGVGDDPAAVASNRDRLLHAIGPGPRRLAWMRQVHGADVVFVDALTGGRHAPAGPWAGASPPVDAIFTDSPLVALGALGADCAAVLIADPVAGLAGAAHAGRPGLGAGVVAALVTAMTAAGAEPGRMHAAIGPSICGRCYEVPAWMRDEAAALVPAAWCVTASGTPGIDLRAGLRFQLAGLGVKRIADDPRCTAESAELFSYRRDGTTGRCAGLIWIAP